MADRALLVGVNTPVPRSTGASDGRPVLYFGYGSNLNVPMMMGRVPHAKLLVPAFLPYHRVGFAGHSRHWGGGTATLIAGMSVVPGVLYLMTRDDLHELDRSENTPTGNHRHNEYVYGLDGTRYEAFMYRQGSGTPVNPPDPRYLSTVIEGRRMHGFRYEDILREARRT